MLCGVGGTSYAPLKTPLPIFRGNVAILNLHCSETGHTGCAGSRGKRATVLRHFLEQSRQGRFPALAIAQVYIGLGEKDQAFEWLDKAIDQRDLDVTLQWDSPYATLRSDPRFTRLLRRMKLV